jgi:hypothetical protein
MYQTKDPSDKSEPVKTVQTTASNSGKVIPLNRFNEDQVKFEFPDDHPYAGVAKAKKELDDELILLRARIIKFFHIPQFLDWVIKLITKKQQP